MIVVIFFLASSPNHPLDGTVDLALQPVKPSRGTLPSELVKRKSDKAKDLSLVRVNSRCIFITGQLKLCARPLMTHDEPLSHHHAFAVPLGTLG